jgi:hypothetical protein
MPVHVIVRRASSGIRRAARRVTELPRAEPTRGVRDHADLLPAGVGLGTFMPPAN